MRHVVLLLALAVIPWTSSFAAEWPPEQVVVPGGPSNVSLGSTGQPAAVDASGRVHLAYHNNRAGDFEVVYSVRSTVGEWASPQVISPPGSSARNGSIVVDQSGEVYVFWEDVTAGESAGDIGYRVRNPDGSWEDAGLLHPAPRFSRKPVAAVDAFNRLHLVWVDGRFSEQQIVYSRADTDRAWSEPQIISIDSIVPDGPNIDTDGFGNVHVVWSDLGEVNPGTVDIVYLRINASAELEPEPVRLVSHLSTAKDPSLAATADGTLHLVWLDNRQENRSPFWEIYYKRFLPDIGWGKDKRFTYDTIKQENPIITEGARNTLNVAWEDYRTGNNPEIYYRQITWETGWDRDLTRLTVDNSASVFPSLVALADGGLLLFWADRQGTATSRIYTKIGSEGPAP
jgi:hypothetical protein